MANHTPEYSSEVGITLHGLPNAHHSLTTFLRRPDQASSICTVLDLLLNSFSQTWVTRDPA